MSTLHKRMTCNDRMKIIDGIDVWVIKLRSIYDDLRPYVNVELFCDDPMYKGDTVKVGPCTVKFAGLDRSRGGCPRAKMVFTADKRVKFEFLEGK